MVAYQLLLQIVNPPDFALRKTNCTSGRGHYLSQGRFFILTPPPPLQDAEDFVTPLPPSHTCRIFAIL